MFIKKNDFKEIPIFLDNSSKYVPWIVSFLALLLILILSTASFIGRGIDIFNKKTNERLTIEIPNDISSGNTAEITDTISEENFKFQQTDRCLKIVRDALTHIEGIKNIEKIEEKHMLSLLERWIDNAHLLKEINLPILIDITFDSRLNRQELSLTLNAVLSSLFTSYHINFCSKWGDSISFFSRSISFIAYFIALALFITVIVIFLFLTRFQLLSHQPILNTLRLIGAPDSSIASSFQKQCFRQCVVGCMLGSFFSIPILYFISALLKILELPSIVSVQLTCFHVSSFGLLFIILSVVCSYACRFSILSFLKSLNNANSDMLQ
jgi:cell division protein FtsX